MEQCSISPVTRLAALRRLTFLLLFAVVVTPPSTCDNSKSEGQVEALSAQLSITAQATPMVTAVDWGPTQPLEDETQHFLSSQETDHLLHSGHHVATATAESWPRHQSAPSSPQTQEPLVEAEVEDEYEGRKAKEEPEEVDPQFYVTVTISSLLILTAVIITAKLCYDRSCSHHPPPLSRGVPPPLSFALPRSLASEDSRQPLQSTPSFTDRERIPVVNL